jgi:hypothetical protein
MKQSEIVGAFAGADLSWVEIAPNVEVMASPFRVGDELVAVSAKTARACAAALTRDGWSCTLTTPKVEDMIYAQAALTPEPVLLNPSKIDIASGQAIVEHSRRLLERIGRQPASTLIACGKSWVLSNGLLNHPSRAANYGLFSTSAPYKSANGAFRLWQPLSFAHNSEHYDYSQLLRLVRRRAGAELPSYDQPLRVPEAQPATTPAAVVEPVAAPVSVTPPDAPAVGTLGERCLAWCLEEMASHATPSAQRIAEYHAVAVRNGKLLGIKRGNHCASAQSLAMVESSLPGDVRPHEPRAAAVELQLDAQRLGRWRSIADVRAGKWLPAPGDLAIYDRSVAGKASTAWQRHVDRVVRVSDDRKSYENVGANETNAGAWKREWTPLSHPKLLGFIEYPAGPASPIEVGDLGPEHVG